MSDKQNDLAASRPDGEARESRQMNRATYRVMVADDLAWLKGQPRTLERDHVIAIVKDSAKFYYAAPPVDGEARPQEAWIRTLAESLDFAAQIPASLSPWEKEDGWLPEDTLPDSVGGQVWVARENPYHPAGWNVRVEGTPVIQLKGQRLYWKPLDSMAPPRRRSCAP